MIGIDKTGIALRYISVWIICHADRIDHITRIMLKKKTLKNILTVGIIFQFSKQIQKIEKSYICHISKKAIYLHSNVVYFVILYAIFRIIICDNNAKQSNTKRFSFKYL